jgi:hypothetical protein
VFSGWVWPEMKKVAGDGVTAIVGHGMGHASPVVSSSPEVSSELVGGLVVCFSISGVLSLF